MNLPMAQNVPGASEIIFKMNDLEKLRSEAIARFLKVTGEPAEKFFLKWWQRDSFF